MTLQNFQDEGHLEGHDYSKGSPHLKHPEIRNHIKEIITREVKSIISTRGTCEVLEIGAGHGVFASVAHDAGASVVVTEMSAASFAFLEKTFGESESFEVIHDPGGSWVSTTPRKFDLVLCISVLHHIPDYLAYLKDIFGRVRQWGSVISWQDPLFYSRLSPISRLIDQLSYFLWRLFQGNVRRGLETRWRRFRGVYDDSNPSDMVEYHVVRGGLDEKAILNLAHIYFEIVAIDTYFSTQSQVIQFFAPVLPKNTFGLLLQRKV